MLQLSVFTLWEGSAALAPCMGGTELVSVPLQALGSLANTTPTVSLGDHISKVPSKVQFTLSKG